ncbi:mycothiol synthase [Humibacter soli]
MQDDALTVRRIEPEHSSSVLAVADVAREVDGTDAFNEQTRLDLASGRRTGHLGSVGERPVAAAVTGGGELDLVVAPAERGRGYGTALLERLLPELESDVSAWSHGDHPAARALAASHGFEAVRTLLELLLPDLGHDATGETPSSIAAKRGIRITPFDPTTDVAEWVALNARVFASHPEQGGVTAADLAERMAEPWFDAADFLIARDDHDVMIGYDWLKLEPDSDTGEIYVLGVAPEAAGKGVGSVLLAEGLRRMRSRGRTRASLYVEGDNTPALALYRRAGFVDHKVDIHYRRRA